MTKKLLLWSGCVMAIAVAGCNGPTETPDTGVVPSDGGPDGGTRDVGVDGGHDAMTTDVGVDGGRDGGTDGGMVADFRIDSLATTGCRTVEASGVVDDDRGGVGVSGAGVYLTGDHATGLFPLGLTETTGTLSSVASDAIVSDLATGQLYVLADATGPLGPDVTTPAHITRLLTVANDGSIGAGVVTLASPIDAGGDTGIFAGSGEIGIHDGTNLHVITVATGAVTDLGAIDVSDFQTCENWAYWGVLEHVGTAHSIVAANGFEDRIVRVDVATNTATDIGTFTLLNDMCTITVSPTLHRWYFHHEADSQFAATTAEALGYCDATIDTSTGNFHIGSLDTTNCHVIEALPTIGDDRGGIAVTTTNVFATGDGFVGTSALGRWALDLTGSATSATTTDSLGSTAPPLDGVVTNFHSGQVWALGTATELLTSNDGGDLARLVLLGSDGTPTTTVVTLSASITVDTFGVGFFSGWDEIAVHDGTNLWLVALPSGTVTDLGAMTMPDHQDCESDYYFGVLEHFGGARYVVFADAGATVPVIARAHVPDAATTTIATFTDINDMCSFAIAPSANRWYFHHESTSQLTTTDLIETIGYCDGTFTHP